MDPSLPMVLGLLGEQSASDAGCRRRALQNSLLRLTIIALTFLVGSGGGVPVGPSAPALGRSRVGGSETSCFWPGQGGIPRVKDAERIS